MQRTFVLRTLTLAGVAVLAASASAQITIDVSTTAFVDISSTGTSPGNATDDGEFTVTAAQLVGWAGNELLPAGSDIRIGNNGGVLWVPGNLATEVGYINSTTLPTMAASNFGTTGNGGLSAGCTMLCPLWDDNFPSTGQTANCLDWQVIGGNLIIQWSFEDHFNAQGSGTVQYELIAYPNVTIASRQTLVEFVYNDTFYAANQYQNDGGSATIGYKNWGVIANANDVEFGTGGGNETINDPPFGDPTMKPKVGGYVENADPLLPHAVRIFGLTPQPTTYCTSKINSAGCFQFITFSGNSSASSSTGFDVAALNVRNQRPGLLAYTNAGRDAVPFAGGWRCLALPVSRSVVVQAGGTPLPVNDCSGMLALDVNAFASGSLGGTPAAYLTQPGTTVDCQFWGRDQGFPAPNNLSLTDALEYVVGP